tara:strand:+ start:1709 stop:2326 length:618 start_codon:yes stop_codon:yes gene_type:complete
MTKPTDEPSELQKVLDAINLVTLGLYASQGDEASIAKLKEMEDLPEPMQKLIAEPEPPVDTPPVEAPVDTPPVETPPAVPPAHAAYGVPKPVAGDFESEVDYAKALIRWDSATKAAARPTYSFKVPEKNDFFSDEEFKTAKAHYDTFVKALQEDLSPVLGAAIKKSFVPDMQPIEQESIDFAALYAAAEGADTFDAYASKVKIND